ncbi:hypothetical protein CFP56_010301 [Quercus suber]|uniref:Uncharacterized protein n=1 Tax=Quercus suber TaxID=58331 RepID=A0AAW0L2B0_QUESU
MVTRMKLLAVAGFLVFIVSIEDATMTAIQHVVIAISGSNHHYVCNAAKKILDKQVCFLGSDTGFADMH